MRTPMFAALFLTAAAVALDAKPASLRSNNEFLLTGFGRTVAMAGDVAFVGEPSQGSAGGRRGGGGGGGGAPGAAPAPAPDPKTVAGVVHVYRRGATGIWKETEKFQAPEPKANDGFGTVLTTDGTTLLVSRVGAADENAGGVFVYRKAADGKWNAAGTLPSTAGALSNFGTATAIAGEWAAVGAPGAGATGGTVYLFRRGANGAWTASGSLTQPDGTVTDRFGASVAIDDGRVAVGAPGRDAKGRVYVYLVMPDGNTSLEGSVTSRAVPDNSGLGSSILLKGDRLVVGGPTANFATVAAAAPGRGGAQGAGAQGAQGAGRGGAASFDSILGVTIQRIRGGNFAADSATIVAALRASAAAGGRGANGGNGRQGGGQQGAGGAQQGNIPAVAPNPCAGGGGRGGGGGATTPGVVVAFVRSGTGIWQEKGALTPFDVGNGCFGSALGFAGDEIWIGAPTSSTVGQIYRAKLEKDGTWSTMNKLSVPNLDGAVQFGAAFAVGPTAAVIGMPGDASGLGAVTFLSRAAAAPTWTLAMTASPPIIDPIAGIAGKEAMCESGKISVFKCENTSLYAYMPISKIGGKPGISLSGMWGWTDPLTGHDIALIGRTDGTAFVDVTDPVNPRYLGDMLRTPGATVTSWRELKTYRDYVVVVSDGSGSVHGVQIFDLKRLRAVKGAPQRFLPDVVYPLGSIHNIVVSEEAGFIYAVGSAGGGGEMCGGALHVIDMKVPLKPKFGGCFADSLTGRRNTGYIHDAECVTYRGPDKRYTGHEVCIMAAETMISIQDVTDKSKMKVISRASYPEVGYAHQGAFSTDQRYWYFDDELDEGSGRGKASTGSRTLIWDFVDLENPVLVKEFIGTTKATDHNQYVKGNRLYQSNYQAGLRIIDITDPINIREVGSLQTTTNENITASMSGSWSNYPFFKNGAIGVVSMGQGFFIVKDRTKTVP